MADRVDAAIAALKVVQKEAEKSGDLWWKARRANCWIDQLPGSWWGRWRYLRLRGDLSGDIERRLFINAGRCRISLSQKLQRQDNTKEAGRDATHQGIKLFRTHSTSGLMWEYMWERQNVCFKNTLQIKGLRCNVGGVGGI
jgi:hypothetical protein